LFQPELEECKKDSVISKEINMSWEIVEILTNNEQYIQLFKKRIEDIILRI